MVCGLFPVITKRAVGSALIRIRVPIAHSKGLKFGVYTARGSRTCQNRPGAYGHEGLDGVLHGWSSAEECWAMCSPNLLRLGLGLPQECAR